MKVPVSQGAFGVISGTASIAWFPFQQMGFLELSCVSSHAF